MQSRHSPLLAALVLGLLAGVSYPLAEIALQCRRPSSEECFWAKELFLPTLVLSIAIVGSVVAALVYAALAWSGRRRQSNDDAA